MKHITLLLILIFFPLALLNAQVKVSLQAPSQVEEGQTFRISYVVNTSDVDDLQVGEFTGFDNLYGPSRSTSRSVSIVNGKMSNTSQATFTYTLRARKAGSYKIPAATIKSDGQTYKSNQAMVQVLPSDGADNGNDDGSNADNSGGATRQRLQNAGEKISKKDLYITVTASKRKIYEQEAVLLTYKLYTLVSIDQCMGKMPDLDGFHTQEIELPQQKTLKYERVNGRNYGTVVWSQYVLFPQKTGKLTVPAIDFECEVVQQDRSIDPFEAFFGGGNSLIRVKKTVVAPSVELEVEPLPTRPANFSGAVGSQFHLSGTLTPEQVDANDAVTLRLVVSGVGNMKLMKAPVISWPKDFESYDPKVSDKTKIGSNGASGNVVYDYTAVPRHGGRYVVPPVEFCYFDTNTKSYKTLRTDSFHVAVAKTFSNGAARVQNQEDLTVLNSDIRHIKTSPLRLKEKDVSFFGTSHYLLSYLFSILAFLLSAYVLHLYSKSKTSTSKIRTRKAGRVASKRLKTASKLLKGGNSILFYEEVVRALCGYAGDKLNMPVADLTKERVSEQLVARGVSEESVQQFMRVLNDCEFARYAPGDPAATMEKLYSEAANAINQIESYKL